jgi:hypothetical protein
MRSLAWITVGTWVAILLTQTNVDGKNAERSLLYTFQRSRLEIVAVFIVDSSSGPKGAVQVVQFANASQKQIPFSVSQKQFDSLCSTFTSSGIDKYPIEQVRNAIDLDFYYVFSAGNQKYAVRKNKASPAVVALASRMQRYAPDKAIGLQNPSRSAQPRGPERVIAH